MREDTRIEPRLPTLQALAKSTSYLHGLIPPQLTPQLGVVLGSGWGASQPPLEDAMSIPYSQIPGFPPSLSGVEGHNRTLVIGRLGKTPIAILSGRNHGYEGFSASEVVHGVRTVVSLGARTMVLTNAAGCLEPHWDLGELMVITDHINMTGTSPLVGEGGQGLGPRFLPMGHCYAPSLMAHFLHQAKKSQMVLRQGVYCGLMGPAYETPAEVRMVRSWGASAVGMSTVLEAMACHHMGAQVCGISCMTNYGESLVPGRPPLNHSEVLDVTAQAQKAIGAIFWEGLKRLVDP